MKDKTNEEIEKIEESQPEEIKTPEEEIAEQIKEPTVEDLLKDNLDQSTKFLNTVQSLIAKTEAINLIVEVLNSFLAVRQKDETRKLTDEEINAIQQVLNVEIAKNNLLFKKLKENYHMPE